GVKDAVVVAKELPGSHDKRLVAYVVTDAVEESDLPGDDSAVLRSQDFTEALRHHTSQSLPDYMVPSAIVLLARLPLTPNGKVDRKALPDPDMSSLQASYVAPRTETEQVLCEIWQEVLGI